MVAVKSAKQASRTQFSILNSRSLWNLEDQKKTVVPVGRPFFLYYAIRTERSLNARKVSETGARDIIV